MEHSTHSVGPCFSTFEREFGELATSIFSHTLVCIQNLVHLFEKETADVDIQDCPSNWLLSRHEIFQKAFKQGSIGILSASLRTMLQCLV